MLNARIAPPKTPKTPTCHLCEQGSVELFPAFEVLTRVTSDTHPWPRGGKLGVCDRCGTVQKVIDDVWKQEIASIYENYRIYHQSGGVEQANFDRDDRQASTRSSRILGRFTERFPLAETGRLLDVGCGNGALLRVFATARARWSLVGTEWDDKDRAAVESIAGVGSLYTVPPSDVPGRFDLVTMIHVLEHIPSPRAYLAALREKLGPEGMLIVELPDHRQNPFEMMIADHASHFGPETIAALLEEAGYAVVAVADDWVSRELSVVARPTGASREFTRRLDPAAARASVQRLLKWLGSVAKAASEASQTAQPFGLFGTATAATWLTGELGDRVSFYVDEDPSRIGRAHLGRPIYAPSQAPAGSRVFVALPSASAESVARRFAGSQASYEPPPPSPGGVTHEDQRDLGRPSQL